MRFPFLVTLIYCVTLNLLTGLSQNCNCFLFFRIWTHENHACDVICRNILP